VRRNKKNGMLKPVVFVAVMVLVAVGAYHLWPRDGAAEPDAASEPNAPNGGEAVHGELVAENGRPAPHGRPEQAEPNEPVSEKRGADVQEARLVPEKTPEFPALPAVSAEEANKALADGQAALAEGKLLEARTLLNKAYWSGKLPAGRLAELCGKLEELAERTIIGPRSPVLAGDPYTKNYIVQPNEVLSKIERAEKLHVPPPLLLRVNGLRRPADLRALRTYKLVYGPFHAVIRKGEFEMDLFLHREGRPRVFIKRMKVGLGKNGSTPEGMWRVRLAGTKIGGLKFGGKSAQTTWYPPVGSDSRDPVLFGDGGYPLGPQGLWIPLQGLEEHNATLTDYAIHGTSDPGSIGKAASLGCIRLGAEDIDLAYSLLYEHWSLVQVKK